MLSRSPRTSGSPPARLNASLLTHCHTFPRRSVIYRIPLRFYNSDRSIRLEYVRFRRTVQQIIEIFWYILSKHLVSRITIRFAGSLCFFLRNMVCFVKFVFLSKLSLLGAHPHLLLFFHIITSKTWQNWVEFNYRNKITSCIIVFLSSSIRMLDLLQLVVLELQFRHQTRYCRTIWLSFRICSVNFLIYVDKFWKFQLEIP